MEKIDKNLISSNVDRIFITANFSELNEDKNDDNALCRYERFEAKAIVRMAKTKFYEKRICSSICKFLAVKAHP